MPRKKNRNKISNTTKQTSTKTSPTEIWKSLSGYEPAYQLKVSSRGRVVILPEHKTDTTGREYVTLCGRDVPVDLLVAQAFIPNPTRSQQPWHVNGDIRDSRKSNLKWIEFMKDDAVPQRIYSTLSLIQYILHPNILAERDKEFTRFYTYLDYLWKTGQMPVDQEQIVMDGYDAHRKRVIEDFIRRQEMKKRVVDTLDEEYVSACKDNNIRTTDSEQVPNSDSPAMGTSDNPNITTSSAADTKKESESDSHPHILSSTGYRPDYDPDVTSADMEEYYGIRYEDIPDIPRYSTEEIIRDIQHPDFRVDKALMAEALIDLYERAITTVLKNPRKNPKVKAWNWRHASPITDVIRKAITTVVNHGEEYQLMKMHGIDDAELIIKSKKTGKMYRHGYMNPASLLEKSLTAPYHLNTCPQLPTLFKEKELKPTQNIQTLLIQIQKTGELPDWVTDSVSELLAKMNRESSNKREKAYQKMCDGEKKNIEKMEKEQETEKNRKSEEPNADSSTVCPNISTDTQEVPKRKSTSSVYSDYDDYGIGMPVQKATHHTTSTSPGYDEWDAYDAVVTDVKPMGNPYSVDSPDASDASDEPVYDPEVDFDAPASVSEYDSVSAMDKQVTSVSDSTGKKTDKRILRYKSMKEEYPGKWAGDVYVGNNRNPESGINRDVHPDRKKVWADDQIKVLGLPLLINSEPEVDEKGRPVRDEDMMKNVYRDDCEIPMKGPGKDREGLMFLQSERIQRARRAFEDNAMLITGGAYGPDSEKGERMEVSPLYDPAKDITLGMVNNNAGLEESSYYNQLGQKVYHNVRYGEVYDPKRHTLYIPEIQAWPEIFSADIAERNYMDDYVAYLKKHYPEIGDPEIMRKYYEVAKTALNLKVNLLPNCPKNVLERRKRKSSPIRCWLRNGECMVFENIDQAMEATGCTESDIRNCCNGYHRSAKGFRWEYVDMGDMDHVVSSYIKKIMDMVDECGMDVDWDEYIDKGVLKRMKDVEMFRRKVKIGYYDNIGDILKGKTGEELKEEWKEKRKRAWEMIKEVQKDELPEEWEWEKEGDMPGDWRSDECSSLCVDGEEPVGNEDIPGEGEIGYYEEEVDIDDEVRKEDAAVRIERMLGTVMDDSESVGEESGDEGDEKWFRKIMEQEEEKKRRKEERRKKRMEEKMRLKAGKEDDVDDVDIRDLQNELDDL